MLPSLARLALETETKRGIDDADAPETPGRAKHARTRNFVPAATLTDLDRDVQNIIAMTLMNGQGSVENICQSMFRLCAAHGKACDESTWHLACTTLQLNDEGMRDRMFDQLMNEWPIIIEQNPFKAAMEMREKTPWRAAFMMLCRDLYNNRNYRFPQRWLQAMGKHGSQRAKDFLLDELLDNVRDGPLVVLARLKGARNNQADRYQMLDRDLAYAVWRNDLNEVRSLLQRGADANNTTDEAGSPLLFASSRGYHAIVRLMVASGANVNQADRNFRTSLMHASTNGYDETVSALLAADDIEVDKLDSIHETALIKASIAGRVNIVEKLLANDADVDKANSAGSTALMMASRNGHTAVVEALLTNGASVNVADYDGKTALMFASFNDHTAVVNALLENDAVVDKADNQGETALMKASRNGQVDVVERLIAAGAEIDRGDGFGTTPLMKAAYLDHVAVVILLLDKGADVNRVRFHGMTALMDASIEGGINVVRVLLENGADVNKVNKYGNTALMLASREGHAEIAALLRDAGATR